jgi:hypothetical protein
MRYHSVGERGDLYRKVTVRAQEKERAKQRERRKPTPVPQVK